jgi:hypothetical protein
MRIRATIARRARRAIATTIGAITSRKRRSVAAVTSSGDDVTWQRQRADSTMPSMCSALPLMVIAGDPSGSRVTSDPWQSARLQSVDVV